MRKVKKERFGHAIRMLKRIKRKFSFDEFYKMYSSKFDAGPTEAFKIIYFLEDMRFLSVDRIYGASAEVSPDKNPYTIPIYRVTYDKFVERKKKISEEIAKEVVPYDTVSVCNNCGNAFEYDFICNRCGSYDVSIYDGEQIRKAVVRYLNSIKDEDFIYILYSSGRKALKEIALEFIRKNFSRPQADYPYLNVQTQY